MNAASAGILQDWASMHSQVQNGHPWPDFSQQPLRYWLGSAPL